MKKKGTINIIVETDGNKIQVSPEIKATNEQTMCAVSCLLISLIHDYKENKNISFSEAKKYICRAILGSLPTNG